MKKYILLTTILFIFNISCKKEDSLTSSGYLSQDDDVYYYTLCKDEAVCKFSCHKDEIKSLSSENLSTACTKNLAGYDYHQLASPTNSFNTETKKIIESLRNPNILKILDKDDPAFQRVDRMISNYGSCEDIEGNYDICKKCKDCNDSVTGALVGLWKKIQFPNSEIIYKNNLGNIYWSKLMGKMNYEQAEEACSKYKVKHESFGNYTWNLPMEEEVMEEATKYNLGDKFKLSENDFVWIFNMEVDATQASVLPLIQNYGDTLKTKQVNKTESHYVICTGTP